jgi:hypothetical protein
MLTKELLAAKKRKGRIYLKYIDPQSAKAKALASEVLSIFTIGKKKKEISAAIEKLEDHSNFKLVRALSQLIERRCIFKVNSPISPFELRGYVFKKGYVTSKQERQKVLEEAALEFGLTLEEAESSLWADREEEQILFGFDPSLPLPLPSEKELLRQYNLSLTQTLLFGALEVNFTAGGNFRDIFRRIKYFGLMYDVYEKEKLLVNLTGPASIFKKTTKYGTSFAKVIPAIFRAKTWELEAKIETEVGGTKKRRVYDFFLDDSKRELFWIDGEETESFDSAVEKDFAARIKSVMRDWKVRREPTILKAGRHVFIPDFSFERRGLKYYLEVVGFWTDEYLEKKIAKIKAAKAPMTIAVAKALRCTEEDFIDEDDEKKKEVIFYDRVIPLQPVIRKLEELGGKQKEEEIERLKGVSINIKEEEGERDIIPLAELAGRHGVGVDAIRGVISKKLGSNHCIVDDKIVHRSVLEKLRERIEALSDADKDYFEVQKILDEYGLGRDALREMGYKIIWKSLVPQDAKVVRVE